MASTRFCSENSIKVEEAKNSCFIRMQGAHQSEPEKFNSMNLFFCEASVFACSKFVSQLVPGIEVNDAKRTIAAKRVIGFIHESFFKGLDNLSASISCQKQ